MAYISKSKLLFMGAACVCLTAPVYAQTPVIKDISKNGYNVMRHLMRVDETALSLASAKKVERAVMADKVLDDGERKMLQFLLNDTAFRVALPTSQSEASYAKPVSAKAKALFETLLFSKPDAAAPAQAKAEPHQNEAAGVALQRRAEQGGAQAQFDLAIMYDKLPGSQRDIDKKIYWLEKAATQGHAEAQYELAGEYNYGRHFGGTGVDRSFAKSFVLYNQAAAQGHAGAMVQVGQHYKNGYGVDRSEDEAARWFTKAAELGDDWGMFALAVQYLEGCGVPQSRDKAIYWLKKSYALGNENAEDELDDIGELD